MPTLNQKNATRSRLKSKKKLPKCRLTLIRPYPLWIKPKKLLKVSMSKISKL